MATEKRLVDANAFWNLLQQVVYDVFTVHENEGRLTGTASVGYYTETIAEVLKQVPTVDAVEVVHGRWKNIDTREYLGWMCSNCQKWFDSRTNYCPNCGAKMDGERKDNG